MGIAFGHMPRALFVTHQDVANTGLKQWVIRGHDATAGQTKHHINASVFQRLDESFCSCDSLFLAHLILLVGGK
jgi:hypothetical protein